jgi:hypothetical protein
MIVKNLSNRVLIFTYKLGKVILKPGENKVNDAFKEDITNDKAVSFFVNEKQLVIVENDQVNNNDSNTTTKKVNNIVSNNNITKAELLEKIKTIDDVKQLESMLKKESRKVVRKAIAKQISLVNDMQG